MASSDSRIGGSEGASPSEVRGAIDRGQAGDKVAGFDPAASPMETDAEAGGSPSLASGEAPMQADASLPRPNSASHGSAMRPFDDAEHPTVKKPVFIYVGMIVLVALIFFGGVALWA